jgi:hypothetical protein
MTRTVPVIIARLILDVARSANGNSVLIARNLTLPGTMHDAEARFPIPAL